MLSLPILGLQAGSANIPATYFPDFGRVVNLNSAGHYVVRTGAIFVQHYVKARRNSQTNGPLGDRQRHKNKLGHKIITMIFTQTYVQACETKYCQGCHRTQHSIV